MKNLLCCAVTLTLISCLAGGQTTTEASVTTPRYDCETEQFICSDGSRILSPWLCDNDTDCADGSDELPENCVINCTQDGPPFTVDCDKQFFTCKDGYSYQLSWLCDGYNDCLDGSDEKPENCKNYCPTMPTTTPDRLIRKKRFIPWLILALKRAAPAIAAAAAHESIKRSKGNRGSGGASGM